MIVRRGRSWAALLFIVVFVAIGAVVGVSICRFVLSLVTIVDTLRQFGG